ncbi:class I SAM-dependent methyltransferase [Pedobacter changchengzhani]|uniref:Class I SAM-dependent methyltransferase n=1 Tax=Pedobacter changchengzhani TaxID=2529274 RepID=A0A4R5MMQ2_9SPHI|nr:methyltransferase domain-containing protein [Pedobacter changchengzhani]TDG37087.1 class I SAM-dependent methyltransferase [Pedobacter changchengzhani]
MDVFGRALNDYYKNGKADTLWLHNSYGETEEMPIDFFFRDDEDMPVLELQALQMCKGKVLDVGAGVGSHALLLQAFNIDVTAIDVSKTAVTIMKDRGVRKPLLQNIYTFEGKFDTILMLMNGIGLTKTLPGFKEFLIKIKSLLNPGGILLFDSSNVSYLYKDIEKPKNKYFGEVSFQYQYNGGKGSWFKWVYIDEETIKITAEEAGYDYELIFDDGEDQFLVKLSVKD